MLRFDIYPSRLTYCSCAAVLLFSAAVPWLLILPLLYKLMLLAGTAFLTLGCTRYLRALAGYQVLIVDDSGMWLRHSLPLLSDHRRQWLERALVPARYTRPERALTAADQLVKVNLTPLFESRCLLVLDIEPVGEAEKGYVDLPALRWWVLPDSLDEAAQRALRRRFRLQTDGTKTNKP